MSPARRFVLVLACFFLSGFAGLLYETTWTRQFSFVLGTSGVAVSTVLAAYMGGLAAGARIVERFLDRIERPVLVYGVLELGIALAALAVPLAIRAAWTLQTTLLADVVDPVAPASMFFYVVISLVILAVPTTLMGATLPLLARHVVDEDAQVGRRVGVLYAINTAGAVVGTLATSFLLIPEFGLRQTVYVGAAVNAIVFLGAVLAARGGGRSRAKVAHEPPPARPEGGAGGAEAGSIRSTRQLVLGIALGAGTASFIYEVLWVRLLEHVLGGSVFAFSAMLSSFLVGIALGGAIGARFATVRSRAIGALVWSQLGAALGAFVAYHALDQMPLWMAKWGDTGEFASVGLLSAVSALILLPSTLCIGALFPLVVRIAAANADEAGSASARVYAWNTVGSIVGSLAAGFWLLPVFEYGGTLRIAIGLNLLLAVLAWRAKGERSRATLAAAVATVALATVLLPLATPWRLLRSSPIERDVVPPDDEKGVLFQSIGRSASVMAIDTRYGIRVQTNGVPESLIRRPGAMMGLTRPARWMGVLPSLAMDRVERMMVIGLGGGVILEALPDNIERVDVIELEPEMVAANQAIAALRAIDPLGDPRLHLQIADARRVLSLSTELFDAIVSQPSHPWTAGASHLYTRDFFEAVRDRLAPNGYFVQWLGLGFVDEALLQSFVATLTSVFPNVQVYLPYSTSILFLATVEGADPVEGLDRYLEEASNRATLFGLRDRAELRAGLVLDDDGARRFAAGAPIITDDYNIMAVRAPQVRYPLVGRIKRVLAPFEPLAEPRSDVAGVDLLRALLRRKEPQRARRVADGIADPATRAAALVWLEAESRPRDVSDARLLRVSRDSPLHGDVTWTLVKRHRRALASSTEESAWIVSHLEPGTLTVVRGWQLGQAEDWSGLADLDGALAEIPANAPWWEAAVQLRFIWRLRLDRPDGVREALAILDQDPAWTIQRLGLRAAAASRLGEDEGVLDTLRALEARDPRRFTPEFARGALDALEGVASGGVESAERARLAAFFERALSPVGRD